MSEARASRLTAANAVTSIRLLAAPALGAAVLCGASVLAGALFVLAVASDFADGAVARRRGESTAFGGLLDHASDALFCTCGLAALAATGVLTPLLPVLVALAFAQYALDSKVVDGRALRVSALGRLNGIAYYVMLGIPVVRDALRLDWPGPGLVRLLAVALAISTAISMVDRASAWWRERG